MKKAANPFRSISDPPSDGPDELPTLVSAKPRLFEDVKALRELTSSPKPPLRRIRATSSRSVYYGFGDASGSAFGAALQHAYAQEVHFEYGQWLTTVTEEESSNWREFTNVVEFLESKAEDGKLDGAEVFMFTDNSTTEGAFWKGTSTSPKLLELVLRLRKLEMKTGLILHLIHVSGRQN